MHRVNRFAIILNVVFSFLLLVAIGYNDSFFYSGLRAIITIGSISLMIYLFFRYFKTKSVGNFMIFILFGFLLSVEVITFFPNLESKSKSYWYDIDVFFSIFHFVFAFILSFPYLLKMKWSDDNEK